MLIDELKEINKNYDKGWLVDFDRIKADFNDMSQMLKNTAAAYGTRSVVFSKRTMLDYHYYFQEDTVLYKNRQKVLSDMFKKEGLTVVITKDELEEFIIRIEW